MLKKNPFICYFPDDPECVRDLADIEAFECISSEDRFLCNSTPEAIETIVRIHGDCTALTFLPGSNTDSPPRRWRYREYWQEIVAAANFFHELGLQPDQSVAFLLPNVPEALFGIWGAQAVGIAAPINPFLHPEQIANIIRDAEARILVTLGPTKSDELWQKAVTVQRCVPSIQHVVVVGGGAEGAIDWSREVSRQSREVFTFNRQLTGQEIATYFHTGGTTGSPKLAQHTHRAEVVNVCQMMLIGLDKGALDVDRLVAICGMPLFHVNAMMTSLVTIMNGGELILAGPEGFRDKTLIRDFWSLVEKHHVTYFSGVPTIYSALLEQPTAEYDLACLRFGICGAAPMPTSLLRDFRDRTGADIIEGYGMTETTTCATIHPYKGQRKIGSIGLRLPYQKIRIVTLKQDGGIERDCNTEEIGVLLLSGPNVIPAYKQVEANKDAWPEPGWLNSGDMGRCDADGYYWLTGRAKDLIIRGGHNIDPLVTEDALIKHPDVELAAAVGKPDAYAGEIPVAYVQLHAGALATADELKAFAREHVAERAAAPVEVTILEEIPKTAVGKTFKPTLRKDAIARAYQEAAASAWPSGRFAAQVVDDNLHGMAVVVDAFLNDDPSQEIIDAAQKAVAMYCDQLAYTWTLCWRNETNS